MKDVDDQCIGGCVAKSVTGEEEELKFFNTVSLADRDTKIAEVEKRGVYMAGVVTDCCVRQRKYCLLLS